MSTKITFTSLADLQARAGQELCVTDWVLIEQSRIQQFADATDDQQWIHTDEERARRESPFGGTIAHGFLTLSMLAEFLQSSVACESVRMGINYGLNKVRFPAPVRAGQCIRARLGLVSVELLPDNAAQLVWSAVIEVEDGDKPACVAEMVARWYF